MSNSALNITDDHRKSTDLANGTNSCLASARGLTGGGPRAPVRGGEALRVLVAVFPRSTGLIGQSSQHCSSSPTREDSTLTRGTLTGTTEPLCAPAAETEPLCAPAAETEP